MMTMAEKALARAAGLDAVSPNQYVTAKIDMAMMPGNLQTMRRVLAGAGIDENLLKVWDPERFGASVIRKAEGPGSNPMEG